MINNEYIIGFIASIIANFLSALAGGGSGLFLLPALLFLGIPFPIALASHKIATVGLGIGASYRHSQVDGINWKMIIGLCLVGIPGVILGALYAVLIPEQVARLCLGGLILGLALLNLCKLSTPSNSNPDISLTTRSVLGLFGIFIIAILNGSLTSGTGLLFTMWLVQWFGLPFILALSYTMIVCSLVYNMVGALVLGSHVSVDLMFVVLLVVGAVLGGYWGANLSLKKGEAFIKTVFTSSCVLIGSVLLYQGIQGVWFT